MKKTLTVNLGGTVFHIDEDAYVLLDNYLNNLRYHFRNESGAEEIVRDIEMRISELFSECLEGGQQVITVNDVEAVIARMGKPEELDGDTDEAQEETGEQARKETESQPEERTKKQFFRDPSNRVLGGVLSGLAAFLGCDVVVLRLIVILFALVSQMAIPILFAYLIAWVIVPSAQTASERLKMKGKAVNMENIGKTVTDSFNQEQEGGEEKTKRSPLMKIADAVVRVVGLFVKMMLILLLICCIPVLFGGMLVLFLCLLFAAGFLVHVPSFLYEMLPYIEWDTVTSYPVSFFFFILSVILLAGIPLIGVMQLIFQSLGTWKPMSKGVKVGLIVLWGVSVIIGSSFFFHFLFVL